MSSLVETSVLEAAPNLKTKKKQDTNMNIVKILRTGIYESEVRMSWEYLGMETWLGYPTPEL